MVRFWYAFIASKPRGVCILPQRNMGTKSTLKSPPPLHEGTVPPRHAHATRRETETGPRDKKEKGGAGGRFFFHPANPKGRQALRLPFPPTRRERLAPRFSITLTQCWRGFETYFPLFPLRSPRAVLCSGEAPCIQSQRNALSDPFFRFGFNEIFKPRKIQWPPVSAPARPPLRKKPRKRL